MVDTPKIIAVIPARGGSKRIPKKNIRDFKGKPMIAWTIEAALKTNKFHKVIVSTDDKETSAIAREYGAECPFLRQNKHDDIAPVSEATLHAVEQAEQHYSETYDVVVQLMANCPLRNATTIEKMLSDFSEKNADSMLSHTRYGWLNPWWACELGKEGDVKPLFEKQLQKRSQDLPDLYCPTGAIWIAKTEALKKHQTFHSPNKKAFVIDWQEATDIDDEEDWKMAELVFDQLNT